MRNPLTRRWDPIVRVTHWGVAAAIVANGLLTEEGSGLHVWIGYAAGGLLALRLLWGLIGPAEARFSAFPPSLRRAHAHLADIGAGRRTPHRSHNPLGALMAYAVWGVLAVVVATGVAMEGPPRVSTLVLGPAFIERPRHDAGAGEHAEGGHEKEEEVVEEVHEIAANLLFGLAVLHLLGVAFETRRSGREVLTAMVGGGRRAP